MSFDVANKLRAVVRAIVGMPDDPGQPPIFSRMCAYRATVVSATSDGQFCDLQPEDKRIPPAQNVPVRVGVPGLVAVVQPGAVVWLSWEKGDPSRPCCSPVWENGATVVTLTINAQTLKALGSTELDLSAPTVKVDGSVNVVLNGGSLPVARQTDPVTGNAGPYPIASGIVAGGAPKVLA